MARDTTATAYLVVEAERWRYGSPEAHSGLKPVSKIKVVGVRQSRPKKLDLDQVVIKVTIQMPTTVFDPISPQALIIVPEEMVMREIVVEAQDEVDV